MNSDLQNKVSHKTTAGTMLLRFENEPKNHVPATDGRLSKSSRDGTSCEGVLRFGDIGYLFHPGVIDYLAGMNEEIPEVEEYARLFLADRLKMDTTSMGVFLISRKAAMLAPRETFAACEAARTDLSLKILIPLSPRTLIKILARKHDAVLVFGPENIEVCWNETGVSHETPTGPMVLSLKNEPKNHVPAANGTVLKGVFRNQPLSINVACLTAALSGLFGKPIADLADFFERELPLPDSSFSGAGEKLPENASAWKNLALIQPLFQGLVAELNQHLPRGKASLCIFGDLARSGRFVRILQNFLRVPLTPISDVKPILQAFGAEIAVFPPALKFLVPWQATVAVTIMLLLNVYVFQYLLAADLEYLKGMESLHQSIIGMQNTGSGKAFVNEDISWLNRHLEERRISWTRLFNALEGAKPDGVQLESIDNQSREAALFGISGVAGSVESVRGFLANLQGVPGFGNVFLSSYRLQGTNYRFWLSLEYHSADPAQEIIPKSDAK